VFTSGIVSVGQGWKIALYFTGSWHAGENIADVLKQRRAELPSPIRICANSFDYLVELQRHAKELAACPTEWMPWNYRKPLAQNVPHPDLAEL
jgi:hypothetical protein